MNLFLIPYIFLLFVVTNKVTTNLLTTPNYITETCHQSILESIEQKNYQITNNLKQFNHNLKGKAKEIVEAISYNYGPRPVGSDSLNKLVNVLLNNLTATGLDDIKTYETQSLKWLSKEESLEMTHPWNKKMSVFPLIGSPSIVDSPLESEVVVLKSIDDIQQNPSTNSKKIVAVNCRFTTYSETKSCRENVSLLAFKAGYSLALVRSVTQFSLYTLHTGWIGNHQKMVPTLSVTVEDMDLLEEISKTQSITLRATLITESERVPVKHIVGTFLGTNPSAGTIVIGAHMDSMPIGLGALDDASGVAIAIQTMLVLRNYYVSVNKRPTQNINLILWNGEEVEHAMATELLIEQHQKKIFLDQISMVIEADDGNLKPNGLSFKGTEKAASIIERIFRQIEPIINLGTMKITNSNLGSTDAARYSFHKIPSALISTYDDSNEAKYFNYHHSAADVPNVVKSDDLDNNILFLSYLIDALANLPCQLPRN